MFITTDSFEVLELFLATLTDFCDLTASLESAAIDDYKSKRM